MDRETESVRETLRERERQRDRGRDYACGYFDFSLDIIFHILIPCSDSECQNDEPIETNSFFQLGKWEPMSSESRVHQCCQPVANMAASAGTESTRDG